MTQICDYPEHDEAIELLKQVRDQFHFMPSMKDWFISKQVNEFFEKYRL